MNKLSVAIITFNEERNIRKCLESVKDIADEIIVVDSFSTDATERICKEFPVKFVPHAFEGHIEQKNYAITLCSYDLVLSLDADEALTDVLCRSILAVKQQPVADGYYFNRLNHYCSVPVRHSGWYPDRSLRLWNKHKGAWGGNNPHDIFKMNQNTTTAFLKGDLLHYTFHSIEQHIEQINKFSTISAKSKFKKGKKSSWFKIIVFPTWRFIRSFILQCGFLDGYVGYIVCKNSAHAVFLKYMKLYYMQHNHETE